MADGGFSDVVEGMQDRVERLGPRIQLGWAQSGGQLAGGASDAFVVDPERAQACVDALLGAAGDVRKSLNNWRLGWFPPPGRDPVSVNMTHNANEMARRAETSIMAWADQIEATAEALRRELAAYRRVDEANVARRV